MVLMRLLESYEIEIARLVGSLTEVTKLPVLYEIEIVLLFSSEIVSQYRLV